MSCPHNQSSQGDNVPWEQCTQGLSREAALQTTVYPYLLGIWSIVHPGLRAPFYLAYLEAQGCHPP